MGGLVSHPGGWRPPAPQPRVRPLGPIALIGALWKNPLEAWTHAHFEQPMVTANLAIGQATVVNAPADVRRVLLDNAANYQEGHAPTPHDVGGAQQWAVNGRR